MKNILFTFALALSCIVNAQVDPYKAYQDYDLMSWHIDVLNTYADQTCGEGTPCTFPETGATRLYRSTDGVWRTPNQQPVTLVSLVNFVKTVGTVNTDNSEWIIEAWYQVPRTYNGPMRDVPVVLWVTDPCTRTGSLSGDVSYEEYYLGADDDYVSHKRPVVIEYRKTTVTP